MHLPVIPENAPFSEGQRLWLNGYLAGLFSGTSGGSAPPAEVPSLGTWTFIYGTQTGGAETLARKYAKEAKKAGFSTTVHGMDSVSPSVLLKESRLGIIVSTYGDGEMPDNAQAFW